MQSIQNQRGTRTEVCTVDQIAPHHVRTERDTQSDVRETLQRNGFRCVHRASGVVRWPGEGQCGTDVAWS